MVDWKITIAVIVAMLVWVVGLQLVKKIPNIPTGNVYKWQHFGLD